MPARSTGIDTIVRSTVCSSVVQIAHHQPERKEEVSAWFNDLLLTLSRTGVEKNIVDSAFIGLTICDALELREPDMFSGIKAPYDRSYVS
ncbi:MAG: hypothetical protein KAR19_18815 [Bacteroidales bacterium]|nr:hypothetical protein [Bacteroidales bacterium]